MRHGRTEATNAANSAPPAAAGGGCGGEVGDEPPLAATLGPPWTPVAVATGVDATGADARGATLAGMDADVEAGRAGDAAGAATEFAVRGSVDGGELPAGTLLLF